MQKRSKLGMISMIAASVVIIPVVTASVISCSNSDENKNSKQDNSTQKNDSTQTNSQIAVAQPTSNQTQTGINTGSSNLEINTTVSFPNSSNNIKDITCQWKVNNELVSSLLKSSQYETSVNGNTATLIFNSNEDIQALLSSLGIENSTTLSFTAIITANINGETISSSESKPLDIAYTLYSFTAIPQNTDKTIKTITEANANWSKQWSSYNSSKQEGLIVQNFNGKFDKILQTHNENFTKARAFPYAKSSIASWTYTEAVSIESAKITLTSNNEYDIEIIMQGIYSTSNWNDFATVTETLNIDGATFSSQVINGSNYGESGYYGGLALTNYSSATLSIAIQYSTQPSTITDTEFSDIKYSMSFLAPTYMNKQIPENSSMAKELMQNADIIIASSDGINYGSLNN